MILRKNFIIQMIIILLLIASFIQPGIAQEDTSIFLDYYYDSTCGECQIKLDFVQNTFVNKTTYTDYLTVNILIINENDDAYNEWERICIESFNYTIYPIIVIRNDEFTSDAIDEFHMDKETIDDIILSIQNGDYKKNDRENIISTPWGDIDVSTWSIPILTVVLGSLDSFNPCAFFILLFLLNLLIYARSKKRMLLIGGIFIFFSGFLYMLFMFLMYEVLNSIKPAENIFFITIIVGLIVLPMGILNIKDFFFFKKGASLSIPDDKKPKIYKKMRGLVKNKKLGATIIGTIILAATVNFYELLCTLGLPFAFINQLARYSVSDTSVSYYFYILLYNIVYVIPLIIIVFLFVFTLGKRKLSEWHGQIMKLISGIMLSSFGLIFLIDYTILENPITPILLLLFSLTTTAIIAVIWKRFVKIPSDDLLEKNEE